VLHLLDESLEAFLRSAVPLPGDEVDVAFEAPDRDWGSGISKPTVNLFLWDVRRNLEEREAGVRLVDGPDGKRYRRPPLPRVDCRYLVTAWTSEVHDEHQLLGQVLATLLCTPELAAGHLAGGYAAVRPLPSLSVAELDGRDNADFWSALGGQLKPGLDLVVTATVDASVLAEAGAPAEGYELTVRDKRPARGGQAPASSRTLSVGGQAEGAAGATVRSPRGATTADERGTFLVPAEPGDDVVVEGDPPTRRRVRRKGRLR